MEMEFPPINWLAMTKKLSLFGTLLGAASILLVSDVSRLGATDTPIGMAVANGSFFVDHSRVWGNTTLFEGSVIETSTAASEVQVNGGVMMRLFRDRGCGCRARAIIGHDDLEPLVGLPRQGAQDGAERILSIVGRHDDGDQLSHRDAP